MRVTQSCLTLATPWTVAPQVPQLLEFSRQEFWSGSPLPSPGALPHPGIEPGSPAEQAGSLPSEPAGKPLALQSVVFCPGRPKTRALYAPNLSRVFLLSSLLWEF